MTHDQTEAMTLADQIVVLRKGHIEQVGAPLDLYRKPANLFVAGFIGTPRINLFTVDRCEAMGMSTVLHFGATQLKLPLLLSSDTRTIGFRPEQAKPVPTGSNIPGHVLFELQDCETQAVEHLGDRAYCYLRSNMGELVVLAPDVDSSFHGRLTLAIDVSALHFFDSREAAIKFE